MTGTHRLESVSAVAFALQAMLLARLAGAEPALAGAALVLAAVGAFAFVPALQRRWPEATAMLAIGGLGMTLGWWADLGFRSAAEAAPHSAAALDTLWCRSPFGQAPLFGHLLSWMNAGMLALGLPAMALAYRASPRGQGAGSAIACALAMIIGMTAGSWVAARLAVSLEPPLAVLCDWLGMTLGMLAGMAVVGHRATVASLGRPIPG